MLVFYGDSLYNSGMKQLLLRSLRYRFGLWILCAFLLWITVTNIHPGMYFIGWDNYSTYLGGFYGILRTIFSTWRAYRGIGVPGDSESADLVRQLIVFVLRPLVSVPVADQIYVLLCLWIGVLSVYALMRRILARHVHHDDALMEFASTIAAFSYVLNLNALATFYFPIMTYITRYASLPLLILTADRYTYQKNNKTAALVFVGACLFSMGSYITATVFFTTLVLLGLYIFTQGQWRRGFVLLALFVSSQMFWLLPFVRYAGHKSEALRLAPVFIDTNEAQLNQSKESYGLWKQMMLYPNFFNTRYTRVDTGQNVPFHEATKALTTPLGNITTSIYILGSILGIMLIVWRARKDKTLLWAPVVYVLFTALSTQEHSVLGFIPALLNKIPYFQIVFRFGDTKFHPYVALSASILIGVTVMSAINAFRVLKIKRNIAIGTLSTICVLLPLIVLYRSYITGNFLPRFLFVRMPDAYAHVAEGINSSNQNGRVLHLPYDPDLYWRSHTWGYFGSAWMQDLLYVPYMDKTFEPASLETTAWYQQLTHVIADANQVSGEQMKSRADAFMRLLREAHIQHIVFDTSVSPEIRVRNMRFWGAYNKTDVSSLLSYLAQQGRLQKIHEYPIDLAPIAASYRVALGQEPQEPLGTAGLTLYAVQDAQSATTLIKERVSVDSAWQNVGEQTENGVVFEESAIDDAYVFDPLTQKNAMVSVDMNGVSLELGKADTSHQSATFATRDDAYHVLDTTVQWESDAFIMRIYVRMAPTIAGKDVRLLVYEKRVPVDASFITRHQASALEYLANWHVIGAAWYAPYRMRIGSVVIPVPIAESGVEQKVVSVLVRGDTPSISVLEMTEDASIDTSTIRLTDVPNCFGDKLADSYRYVLNHEQGARLMSENGSTCMVLPLSAHPDSYREIRFEYRALGSLEAEDQPNITKSDKLSVSTYIASMSKPNLFSVCLTTDANGVCANTHQMMRLKEWGTVVVPAEVTVSQDVTGLRMALVPVGNQAQEITIMGGLVATYMPIVSDELHISVPERVETVSWGSRGLTVTLPYILSEGSYYSHPYDGMFITNRPCEQAGGYRTVREVTGGLLSYLYGCYVEYSVPRMFDSRTAKLWAASYVVHAGKQPKMLLSDTFGHYVDQYASVYQGYPTVRGMLNLQKPEAWYRSYSPAYIRQLTEEPSLTWSYALVPAVNDIADTREKSYVFHQDSQNEGIVQVGGTVIIEYPPSWNDIRLAVGHPTERFDTNATISETEMFPSLVRVRIVGDQMPRYIQTSRAYDSGWRAYPSIISLIFGTGSVSPKKCNTLYQCYELPTSGTWYLFYTPERLTLIGWGITLIAFWICVFISRKRLRA